MVKLPYERQHGEVRKSLVRHRLDYKKLKCVRAGSESTVPYRAVNGG